MEKEQIYWITTIVLIFILFGGAFWVLTGESRKEKQADEVVETEVTELVIEDTLVGEGEEAQSGDKVSMHYTGTLTDGSKFDSSLDRGEPFEFTIGAGEVIQGWEQGIPGMRVGGTRTLTIPADLGYGANERPGIPANSTLIFEVELLEIVEKGSTEEVAE